MARRTSDQLFAQLNAEAEANASDDRHLAAATEEGLSRQYGPRVGRVYFEECAHVEHMLDGAWPSWDALTPKQRAYGHLGKPDRRLVSWLLKRRAMILCGQGANGVKVIEHGKKIVAIPVTRKRGSHLKNPEAFVTCVSPPKLSADLGVSLSVVEAALAGVDPHHAGTWADCVREYVAAQAEPVQETTPAVEVAAPDEPTATKKTVKS